MDLRLEKYGPSFDIKKYTTSGWALEDENVIGIRAFKFGCNWYCMKVEKILHKLKKFSHQFSQYLKQCAPGFLAHFSTVDPGGATRMARGGIRFVHGHTKSTLITYFSGMKIHPKYAFLHKFFLICPSCPFQNLSIWPKTHPFFRFCTPKRCTRVQCLVLKNNPNYVNFWKKFFQNILICCTYYFRTISWHIQSIVVHWQRTGTA